MNLSSLKCICEFWVLRPLYLKTNLQCHIKTRCSFQHGQTLSFLKIHLLYILYVFDSNLKQQISITLWCHQRGTPPQKNNYRQVFNLCYFLNVYFAWKNESPCIFLIHVFSCEQQLNKKVCLCVCVRVSVCVYVPCLFLTTVTLDIFRECSLTHSQLLSLRVIL